MNNSGIFIEKENRMIITGIPFDEKLNIGVLSKVFERKRISNCYKYFWFQAILENIVEDKVVFTYDEILNQMIEDAWYMVTEFKLRLGPCNTTDNLEEVVKYIHSKSNISSTAKRGSVIQYLKENTDPQIKKYKKCLIENVPYCMQSPFYSSIKNPGQSKVYKINEQTHLLYYFVALEGIFSKFEINEEWVDYLIRNRTILLEWVRYNLIGYLQDRNPNVPGIVEKVQKPEKRDLRRVSDYWKTIIEIDPKIKEIYQKVSLKDKSISIDHFVPWQYLSHDELWNLSPTTKNINSMKGNQLPNLYEDFERLAELQHKALMMCNDYEIVRHKFKICLDYHVNSTEIRNSLYQPDIDLPSYRERLYNVIQPVYDSAKMGGFTEWIK